MALRVSICLALLLSLIAPGVSKAQTPPAGNAHPETHALADAAEARYPFGEPTVTAFDPDAKRKFSREVDLAPLRDLAVFHNGRPKVLDTLARETIGTILGRKDYVDVRIDPGTHRGSKVHYDTLFTYVDMLIDPGYYADKPLVHVEYLPLREAFLDAVHTGTGPEVAEQKEWWKRLGRLKPLDVVRVGDRIEAEHSFELPFRRAMDKVRSSVALYQFSWRNLLMIAPDAPDKEWHHLSELAPDSPAGVALADLAAAWRAGDAPRVNAAAAVLGRELPKINGPFYPTTRRVVERVYNASNAFEWGFWMYALSMVSLLLAFGTGRRWLVRLGLATLAVALLLHAGGFAARCFIAERFAIQNQFESMTGLSLFAVLVGTAIMVVRRQWLFGAAAATVGFLVLITATQTGIPGQVVEREAPILNTSVLLKYHVTTVLVSYGLISLGLVISLFYLATHYATRRRAGVAGEPRLVGVGGGVIETGGAPMVEASASALGLDEDAPKGPARVLADLDTAQMIVLQLAFWTLGVGILLGAWWADHSWGRFWAFDPKELWALVTWIVYLVVIHIRFTTGHNRALTTAWLSVLGFVVMFWTYFGVNLLLPGLHAYA